MSDMNMTKPKIGVIGECMIELSYSKMGIHKNYGGDTLNTAIYLKRSAPNLAVSYITALGVDSFSNEMIKLWSAEGIICDYVLRDKNRLPGLYVIETDDNGERRFLYWRNDSAAKYWLAQPNTYQILDRISTFDVIYLSGISLAILSEPNRQKLIDSLNRAKLSGTKIIFDNNFRPKLWESAAIAQKYYQAILEITFMAFLTSDDDYLLWNESSTNDILKRTQQFGVEYIVIKQGSAPCIIATKNQCYTVPAKKIDAKQIIDTTAAGDSFSAGFLAAYFNGYDEQQSACYAHTLAASVIQHKGAIISREQIPTIKASISQLTR